MMRSPDDFREIFQGKTPLQMAAFLLDDLAHYPQGRWLEHGDDDQRRVANALLAMLPATEFVPAAFDPPKPLKEYHAGMSFEEMSDCMPTMPLVVGGERRREWHHDKPLFFGTKKGL